MPDQLSPRLLQGALLPLRARQINAPWISGPEPWRDLFGLRQYLFFSDHTPFQSSGGWSSKRYWYHEYDGPS